MGLHGDSGDGEGGNGLNIQQKREPVHIDLVPES
jgi:hypothetical protein